MADITIATETRSIFLGTTRVFDNGAFGSDRSEQTNFARYDISIPPNRGKGTILATRKELDPTTTFLVRHVDQFQSPEAFRKNLSTALGRSKDGHREATIYVHGFNNTFADGMLRITQLAEDFELPGVAVHYSWPSAGNPLGYAYDRDSILYARDGLEELIHQVKQAGADKIIIVAHSMGSMLTMETLRQMEIAAPGSVLRDIGGVILMSPDLDIELFRTQVKRIGVLPQPFGIFVSKRDRVLMLSARLSGHRNRLGNVDSVEKVKDLNVTIIDVTDFSSGVGHFTVGTSAAVIDIFTNAGALNEAFKGDRAGRTGLISGTVLTVQNATSIILSPVTALAKAAKN
jgi:esterase/lipase superfamily enzyme